jgi:hypothetical protein
LGRGSKLQALIFEPWRAEWARPGHGRSHLGQGSRITALGVQIWVRVRGLRPWAFRFGSGLEDQGPRPKIWSPGVFKHCVFYCPSGMDGVRNASESALFQACTREIAYRISVSTDFFYKSYCSNRWFWAFSNRIFAVSASCHFVKPAKKRAILLLKVRSVL